MKKYLKIWWQLALINFESQYGSGSKLNTALLILGKLIRLGFVLLFLIFLLDHSKTIAGYSLFQTLLFFMTFNLIDIVVQFFFRGIYVTRSLVQQGYLDGILIKPIDPLFRLAAHIIDFLDLLTLVPVTAILIYVISKLETPITPGGVLLYLLLGLVGFVIAMAIHIFVAALAVVTQEIDNEIWIYRDLMTMGRFPVDIYSAPVQFILTFVVPISVMISFPAKALMGLLTGEWVMMAVVIAVVFLTSSLLYWSYALRKYSSVSS